MIIKMYKQWRERGGRKGEKAYFRKFIADILSRYPCLQNSETFSRGLCNARIKRVELRTLVRWIHTVIDALNFRIYVSRSFRPLLLLVESWLATFVRYRKSRFSIIAKSREAQSWYSSCHSSKRNCNKVFCVQGRRPMYVCVCVRFFLDENYPKFLKNGWIAIANHRSSL